MIDLPDVIELNVIQDDIDNAKVDCSNLCTQCVVGRALNRQFPQYLGMAYNTDVGFYNKKDIGTRKKYNMCQVGKDIVEKFNRYEHGQQLDIQPCTITLTVRNEL